MENEERFRRIEEAIVIMKELLVRHEERLDDHQKRSDDHQEELNNHFLLMEKARVEREASREDFEFKLNALIDTQIQNQIGIRQLKEASQSHLQRIEKLENN